VGEGGFNSRGSLDLIQDHHKIRIMFTKVSDGVV